MLAESVHMLYMAKVIICMHQMSLYLHDDRSILAGGGTLFCYNEDQNRYRAKDRVYLKLTAKIMSAYNGCPQVTYDNSVD